MFVHSVFFWLKDEITLPQKMTFRAGLESLRMCDSVRALYVGVPASTNRPVVDRSYTFALTVVFDDLEGHDAYQVHPMHKKFVDNFSSYWQRVLIYDAC